MHNIFNQMAASEDLAMAIDLDGKDEKEYRLQQILDVVAERFQKRRRIYTRIGSRDLLAVNPSDQLPIYDRAVMVQYASQQQPPNTQEAHIFGIAAQTLGEIQNLDETGADNKSAILFCGEAGAGKTENVFHALRYLVFAKEQETTMAGEKDAKNRIKFDVHLVDALQRVMAAFGSAKTLKNEHSTRHGYSLNVHYFRTLLVGISIDPLVPLELSRLIQQKKGERNFSVFYQLCSGIGPEEREKLGLKSATNYFYLNQGKCAGLELKKEAEQFVALCQALERIGFSEHQRQLIFRLLAVILHCGNLFFRAEKSANADEANEPEEAEATEFAELANEAELRWIAMLLDVDFGQLWRLFTQGSPQGNRLSVDAALDRRDWFAKCIYGQLFRWLTSRISLFLYIPHENYSDNGNAKIRSQISFVDLPGHERYNNNDYEEFCVNLVSEKLERFFQQKVFGQFRDEELREARSGLAHNQWPNNERILDLLTGGPTGILPLLDDECKFPKGSDETFLQHCNINHLDKPIYAKARLKGRLEMGIRQHFGLAFYAVEGFLQRNRFMQPAAFLQVLSKSKDAALASIFSAAPERCAGGGDKWIHVANEWLRGMDRMGQQLAGSHLHFVRCVRANQERIAGKWDGAAVARQFKTLDLLDHCRAVRLAFPHKIPVPTFAHEFRVLLPSEIVRGQSARQTAKDVLVAQGVRFESHFVLGPLHVFLRDPLFAQLKTLLAFTKDFAAIVIQRNLRQFLGRRAYLLKRAAIIRLQAGYRGWKCRRKVAELRERLSWEQKFGRVESARKFRSRNGSRQQEAEEEEPSKSSAHRLSRQCLRDLPPNLRQLVVAHQEEQQKLGGQQQQQQQARFKQHSKYTAAPKPNVPMAPVPAVDLEQFAAENFKTIILGHRLEPVETPFLPKDSEPEFQQSLAMFKLLLHYQHEPAGTDPELLAMLAKHIVQQAITMPSLRDELFAQLLNQNFDCQCETAKQRIWTLMLSAVHAFAPSSLMFPLLYSQFQAQPPALAQMLIAGLLQVSVLPEMASTNRTFAPTVIEQTAFERRQPTTLTVQFADRESLNVEINSWTTAEEMVQTVLRQRGIGDEFGWGLQLDDGVKCAELAAALFPLDAVAQLENGQMFLPVGMAAQSPFIFFDSAAADCKSAGVKKETLAHDNATKLDKCQQNGGMDQSNGSGMGSESRAWSRQLQHQPGAAQPFYRPDYQFSAPRQNGGSDFSTAGGGSQFVPPMMATASEPVRQRFDAVGIQMRRQANAHCMSRITEKDETESMVSSTLPRGGGNNSNNNNNTLNRIRNMPIPDDNEDHQNVEHFLDNIFEQALPPSADYDRDNNNNGDNSAEEKRRRAMVIGQLAASIKGGDFYQPIPVAVQNRPLQFGDHPSRNTGSFFSSREQQQQPMAGAPAPRRFIYRPGGDILLDNGNGNPTHQSAITNLTAARQPYESIGPAGHGKSAPLPPPPPPPPQYYQPNGAFVSSQPMRHLSMANQHANNGGATVPAMPQPPPPAAAVVFGGGGGLRRYNFFPAQHFQSSLGSADHSMDDSSELDDGPVHFGRPVNGDLRSPPPHDGNNRTKNNKYQEVGQPLDEGETDGGEEDTATLKSVDGGGNYGLAMGGQQPRQREEQEHETAAAADGLSAGNDWAPESEATLEALFSSSTGNGHQHRNVCANIYATSGRPKSKCGSDLGDPLLSGQRAKARKLPPALTYVDQPFQLFVRKQIFLPEDVLDEGLEIDLIFAQIIGDCRQRSQMRIRKYERESVNQLLRSYNVSPAMLNTPAQIGSNIKLELISIVRKWPLYFCRLFPCTEERPNGDRVPLLLGVGETGVRLIAITVGGGRPVALSSASEDQQQQLTIQDHFEFSDIADLLQEHGGRALRLITRQHVAVLLTGPSLDQARQCIHQYLGIGTKRRQFVIAVAQYSTNEQNVLSFEAGDYIQLLDKPDSEAPKSAGTWLYGRLDGRFGWLPAEYVLDANSQEDQLYSASCNGLSMSESGGFSAVGASSFGTNGRITLPPVLEPLFANLDPATLFLSAADHAGVDHFTMVEFAIRFFRRPKGESALGGKKHKVDPFNASGNSSWSWKEVTDRVKFTDKPIGHSLLRLESHEADRVAQQAFLCLMRFMGDESLKRNQSYTDCVYELLSLCHQYVLIRDEVYCQLLKQITANRSAKCNESALRGWRLLSIVCAYFQCSETLKPYLLKYLGDVAFDQRRTFNAMAKLCLYNLAQTYRYGGRRLVLGAAEVEAIANDLSVRRQWYNLPGGHRRQICTRAVTVAEEIVQALCLEMNIRGQAEQQEFTLCYMLQKDNSVRTLLNDEYLLDVLTDLETRAEDFLLILMRSVWLHPLRRDSELCTDALFFQLMPNYLAGLYTTLRADGSATASTLDQVATIGALLLLGDPRRQAAETGQAISPADLTGLVPKTVLKFAGISADQWTQRIRAKIEELGELEFGSQIMARQRFLEIVERWPLFGAAFYFVKRVFNGKVLESAENLLAEHCVLAVNKLGIRVLTSEMHQLKGEVALEEIREMAKYSVAEANFLELRLSPSGAQKRGGQEVVTVETDLGNEISRLVGHYIFLSGTPMAAK